MEGRDRKMELRVLECQRCGHRWVARVIEPQKCPACGMREWRKGIKGHENIVKEAGGEDEEKTDGKGVSPQ